MTDNEFLKELVIRSIRGTETMYGEGVLNSILERRLRKGRIGSYFPYDTIQDLRSALENATWEYCSVEQAKEISHGSIALVTNDIVGWNGSMPIDEVPEEWGIDLELLMKESGKLNPTIHIWDGSPLGKEEYFTTLVIEADKGPNGTGLIMSTFVPGFLSMKPNDVGIFDADYKGPRRNLSRDYVKSLGFKEVLVVRD